MRKAILTSFFALFLLSCSTLTPIQTYKHKDDKPIYPAVIKVFQDMAIPMEKMDLFKQEFLSGNLTANDLLSQIRFKLSVHLENNYIVSSLVNMQLKDAETGLWKNNSMPLFFDKNKFCNSISSQINSIVSNPQLYNSAKDKILNDLAFHRYILDDLTEVGREMWIQNNMKGRIFNLNLTLDNFEKNSKPEIHKSFVAYLSCQKIGILPGYRVRLYTNVNRYAGFKKGSLVKTQGQLVNIEDSFLNHQSFVNLIEPEV